MADENLSPPKIEPQQFTAAPMLRRPALIWCVGVLATVPVLIWSNSVVRRLPPSEITLVALLIALFALAPMFIFRWRLRIDEEGLWRRRLFRWDLWPWQAFADGSIRVGDGYFAFYWPNKPWGFRKFGLGLLDKEGRRTVRNILESIWKPPHRDNPPEEVATRILLTTYTFNQNGFEVRQRGQTSAWSWSGLERVEVHRWSHDDPGLRMLNVTTPEDTYSIPLSEAEFQNCTRGEAIDLIVRWVEQAVPPDRVVFVARVGPPWTPEEAQIRIARSREEIRQLRGCVIPLLLISLPCIAWMIWEAAHKPPVDRPFAFIAIGLMLILWVLAFIAPLWIKGSTDDWTDAKQPTVGDDTFN